MRAQGSSRGCGPCNALIDDTPGGSPAPSTGTGALQGGVAATQEEGSHQTLTMPAPRSWPSSLQNCRNKFLLFASHPAYGILLEQPRVTNAGGRGQSRP